jgi:hypothetical protein
VCRRLGEKPLTARQHQIWKCGLPLTDPFAGIRNQSWNQSQEIYSVPDSIPGLRARTDGTEEGVAKGKVTFRYKDYCHGARRKTMTRKAEEFIRRFLLHVLSECFQRIRYYGFLANRYREQKLAQRRELLDMPAPEPAASEASKDYSERYEKLTGSSLSECPVCHQGRMLVIEFLPRSPHRHSSAQGYLMMEKSALESISSSVAQAWSSQATGAPLPNGSFQTGHSKQILRHSPHSIDLITAHYSYRGLTKDRTH